MAIAKLTIDLEARLAGLQAGLDKAGYLAEKQAAKIDSAFSGLKRTATGVGVAFAAMIPAALITNFAAFFRSTVDGLDKLNDLADATGASVEKLSALEDVALRTGTSMETAGDAIIKMNKALSDAKPGSDQAAAFKALGLSIEELKRLDPVEAFQKLAISLQGFANDGNKARIVQELFGKSLKDVAPLLKDMAEAGALNATVTKEQAQAAEDFNKQLFALQKNITDISRTIAGPMVSGMNSLIEKFRQGTKEGKNFAQILAERFAQSNKESLLFGGNTGGATGTWGEPDKPSLPDIGAKPPKLGGGRASAKRSTDWPVDSVQVYQADQLREAFEAIEKINKEWKPVEWFGGEASLYEAEQLRKAFEEIDALNKKAEQGGEKVIKEAGQVGKDLSLVFSSAAGQAITQFESLRDVLKGVLADIAQIALQQVVIKPLQGFLNTAFAGMFADGGYIPPGQWGIVGERGPEIAFGGRGGATIQSGGGGVTINQTLNVGAGVSRNEVAAAMVAAKQSAVAEVYEAQRRGRAFA